MAIPQWLRSFGAFFHLCDPGHRENKMQVLFGHEAAGKGEHGQIVGTWINQGARKPITISFFIEGVPAAPKISPSMLEELFHHARVVGISPSHLCGYAGMMAPRAIRR